MGYYNSQGHKESDTYLRQQQLFYSFEEEADLLILKREDNHHYKPFYKYSPGTQTDQISCLQGLPDSLNQSKKRKQSH